MVIAGADLGNDSLKLVLGVNNEHRMPNAVARQMKHLIRKDLGVEGATNQDIMDDLDVLIESELFNGRYFVGNLAIKVGENTVATGTEKAKNDNLIIPLVTMLALNVTRERNKEEFQLVAGLPIKEVSRDKEAFAKKLSGNYKVTFLSGPLKGRIVEIIISSVVVIPEGVAVVMNQMLNDDASGFRDPSLRTGQVGVIDIGAFTTDIPVIIDGKPDSEASDGLKEGIANYLDEIVKIVNDNYKIKMTRSQLVTNHLEKNDLEIEIKGEKVDVRPMVEESFEIFANKIVGIVDGIWENSYAIKRFYVVGGGAKALKEPLEEEMRKRGITLTFMPENEDPQLQNAMGYWKYGKQKFGAKRK